MAHIDQSATIGLARSAVKPATGRWTHLAGVYDAPARSVRIYIDGQLTGSGSVSTPPQWSTNRAVAVGRERWNGNAIGFWPGQIADVQVFDRVLVEHDFTGQLRSDPDSGGFDEPGILAPIEVGRWDMQAGVSCYLQDLENTCEAPDGTGFDRWLALSRGSEIAAGYGGGLGLQLDGYYFPAENPEPWEPTREYGRSALKTGIDTSTGDPLTVWQDKPVLRTDQSFTVSAWVTMPNVPSKNSTALAQDGGNVSGFYLGTREVSGSQRWSLMLKDSDDYTDTSRFAFSQPLVDTDITSWLHLVGIFDAGGSEIRLYVNGERQGVPVKRETSPGVAVIPWQATGPLTVGRAEYNAQIADLFTGQIDQVRVFQGAMTDAQVKVLYDGQSVM